MVRVAFTTQLRRFVEVDEVWAEGETVRAVLEDVFRQLPALRGYVLDDQQALRKHVNVFLDTNVVTDRTGLTDPVAGVRELFVMQALSGG